MNLIDPSGLNYKLAEYGIPQADYSLSLGFQSFGWYVTQIPEYPAQYTFYTGVNAPQIGGRKPKPPEPDPECFAQLKYRPVQHWSAELVGANHSFWWVQDRTGGRQIISGGKEQRLVMILDHPRSDRPVVKTVKYLRVWASPGDDNGSGDNSGAALAWESGLAPENCDKVEQMLTAANSFPRQTILYDELGPNSNSVARYIGKQGGFSPESPPVAIGWGTPVP